MKIITPGKSFNPFEVTCPHCTARLLIENLEHDLMRSVGGDQRDSWDYLVACCLFCDVEIEIDKSVIPKHQLNAVKRTGR